MSSQTRHELLLKSLTEFARTLLVTYDLDTVLVDLATHLNVLLDLAGTGIGLERDGTLQVASALPDELMTLERVQMAQRTGPCLDAYRSGQIAVCADLRQDQRWPAYRAVAEKAGVVAVLGVPLKLQDHVFGAMNLYSVRARAWSEEDLTIAGVLADMTTGYLVNSSKLRQQEELSRQLQRALDARVVIEQAKGIVAHARGIGVEEAFELIRTHARSHNRRVQEVADAVVNLGLQV